MSERRPEDRHPDVELLADLDAGVFDHDQEARERAAVAGDPRAQAVLAALAATRAELAAHPDPPVPEHVAARWDAALAAEAGSTPVDGPAPLPAARRRRLRPLPVLAAAVAIVAALVAGVLWARPPDVRGELSPGQVDLVALGRSTLGATDAGALADPARRAGCLHAAAPGAIPPDAPLLGGRQVQFGGEQAVLLVLGTGELGRFQVVVVDRDCGPGGGRLLGSALVGGR
jgi:hypothetical protein